MGRREEDTCRESEFSTYVNPSSTFRPAQAFIGRSARSSYPWFTNGVKYVYCSECGRSECGRSECGRSEYGRSEYGRSECGRSEYGRSEYGRSEYGRSEYGRSEWHDVLRGPEQYCRYCRQYCLGSRSGHHATLRSRIQALTFATHVRRRPKGRGVTRSSTCIPARSSRRSSVSNEKRSSRPRRKSAMRERSVRR